MRFLSIRGGASQPFRRRPQALKHLRGGVAVVVCGPDRYDGILLLYLDKKTLSCGRAAAVVPRFNILLLSECQKAEYSDRVPYATRAAAAEAERLHTSLLLEEKVPSAARRMRWRNRDRRNPPHPAGFAVHLPLGGEGYRKRMRRRSAERG